MNLLNYCPINRAIKRCKASPAIPFDLTYNYVTSPLPFLTPFRLAFLRLTLAFYTLFTLVFILAWECIKFGNGERLVVSDICMTTLLTKELNPPATSPISLGSHTSASVLIFGLLEFRHFCMLEGEAVSFI